jgi:HK97 family phage portal protein
VARFRPSDGIPGNKLFSYTDEWGTQHILTSYDVLHIPGFGYDGVVGCSPIRAAAEGIALSLSAERTAGKFFREGAIFAGVLQSEQRLDTDKAAQVQARWKAKHAGLDNAYEIPVLDSGLKFQQIQMGKFYGVPPFLMMETEKSTSWGTGLEQQAMAWVQFDLAPAWLAPTEQRVTKEVLPSGQYSKYALQGLLRGDSHARAEFYTALSQAGALCADEIRGFEDLGPIPDGSGGTYLQPMNMAPLGTDPSQSRARRLRTAPPPPDDDEDEVEDDDDQ